MVVGDWIERNAKRYPNKVAVVFEDKRCSFQEINERANKLCNALIGLGLKKGNRVGILLDNCSQFVEVYGACVKAGMILVPLNTRLIARELAYIINNAEASAVIFRADYLNVIRSLLRECESTKHFIIMGGEAEGMKTYEELLAVGSAEEPDVELREDDILSICYTSGTTGLPKGATITHRNYFYSTIDNVVHYRLRPNSKLLVCMPMFFQATVGSTLAPCFYLGATIVIHRRFDAKLVLETIEKERITFLFLAPSSIIFLLEEPTIKKYDYSSLEVILYGSAPMPVTRLREAMKIFGCKFVQSHGFTEFTCSTTSLEPEDHILEGPEEKIKRLGSCGREMINVRIRVVNHEGKDVKLGEVGELVVTGEKVMKGYWKDHKATEEAIDKDGWLHSGDLATIDQEGYVYIVDRKKDMIVSGGINIYPKEIEEVLFTHPAILEAAVIGVPDDRWGESVKAIVVLKEGMKATEEEVIIYCKECLASYKKPKSLDFVDKLPRNPGGKVLKRELRDPYWKGRDRMV